MIKKIFVPIIDKELVIHVGVKAWPKFVKVVESSGGKFLPHEKEEAPGKDAGMAFGSWIYIDNLDNLNTVIHETLHFLFDTYSMLKCEDEDEFRAYIGAYVLEKVLLWVMEERSKE